MQLILTILVFSSLALNLIAEPATRADFYISPEGSDEWSGTLAKPSEPSGSSGNKADGPFATLERARDAVRDLKQKKAGDILVLIRGGKYVLDKTVVFGLEDAGRENTKITYAAYSDETPIFSSGKEITGWKKLEVAPAGLPEASVGKVKVADFSDRFLTLFDAQGLLARARSAGYIPTKDGGRDRVHLPIGSVKEWSNIEDVEIVVRPHHAWIVNILPLSSVDEKNGIARTSTDATYVMNQLHFLKKDKLKSVWVENVLEELDEPGEWVLNTKEGKVYLWARDDSPVLAPQLTEFIRVEGKIDKMGAKDIPVKNLCFRGLTFKHGERYEITKNDAGLQHDWEMFDKVNALVRFRGTENCSIEKCHFAHSGSGAIRLDLHSQGNAISGNHIEHMGSTGILLCGYGPGTKDVNKKNTVYNNHIHNVGRIYSHSPGIMVWQSGENRVANNLIHHTPYTALIISGCMTEFFSKGKTRELGRTLRRHEMKGLPRKASLEQVRPYLHTHDNIFEYNEIHHAMELLGDGNAIYIRGAGAGNIIRRNYIHHLVAPMIMQAAIRTDGGQMDTLISENLIYQCTSQGILMKLNNRCENNFIVDIIAPPRGYYLSLREGPMTGATIKRNIFYSSSKECHFIDELAPRKRNKSEDRRGRAIARSNQADTDQNIYFCAADPTVSEAMLKKQRLDKVDLHSLATDPLFIDPANGNFNFKPNSPALKLGITPFDVSKSGLRRKINK